ncbi:hypothetical protein HC931_07325 [Candidatus Gracilibacteria bacterium]|nr:hypothetical protein [Candidatus Gracilibacteria bacterium]NJM87133.1 hypothetical protein [Hydrococcus sp. RU_2_2]NJP19300.1 hypothetical protein [Hydrococcus sp. CRU_1_1]
MFESGGFLPRLSRVGNLVLTHRYLNAWLWQFVWASLVFVLSLLIISDYTDLILELELTRDRTDFHDYEVVNRAFMGSRLARAFNFPDSLFYKASLTLIGELIYLLVPKVPTARSRKATS